MSDRRPAAQPDTPRQGAVPSMALPPHAELLDGIELLNDETDILLFLQHASRRIVRSASCPCLSCTEGEDNGLIVMEAAHDARAELARQGRAMPRTNTDAPRVSGSPVTIDLTQESPPSLPESEVNSRQSVQSRSPSVASSRRRSVSRAPYNTTPGMPRSIQREMNRIQDLAASVPIQLPSGNATVQDRSRQVGVTPFSSVAVPSSTSSSQSSLAQSTLTSQPSNQQPTRRPRAPRQRATPSQRAQSLDPTASPRGRPSQADRPRAQPILFTRDNLGNMRHQGLVVPSQPATLPADPNRPASRPRTDLSREGQLALLAQAARERSRPGSRAGIPRFTNNPGEAGAGLTSQTANVGAQLSGGTTAARGTIADGRGASPSLSRGIGAQSSAPQASMGQADLDQGRGPAQQQPPLSYHQAMQQLARQHALGSHPSTQLVAPFQPQTQIAGSSTASGAPGRPTTQQSMHAQQQTGPSLSQLGTLSPYAFNPQHQSQLSSSPPFRNVSHTGGVQPRPAPPLPSQHEQNPYISLNQPTNSSAPIQQTSTQPQTSQPPQNPLPPPSQAQPPQHPPAYVIDPWQYGPVAPGLENWPAPVGPMQQVRPGIWVDRTAARWTWNVAGQWERPRTL